MPGARQRTVRIRHNHVRRARGYQLLLPLCTQWTGTVPALPVPWERTASTCVAQGEFTEKEFEIFVAFTPTHQRFVLTSFHHTCGVGGLQWDYHRAGWRSMGQYRVVYVDGACAAGHHCTHFLCVHHPPIRMVSGTKCPIPLVASQNCISSEVRLYRGGGRWGQGFCLLYMYMYVWMVIRVCVCMLSQNTTRDTETAEKFAHKIQVKKFYGISRNKRSGRCQIVLPPQQHNRQRQHGPARPNARCTPAAFRARAMAATPLLHQPSRFVKWRGGAVCRQRHQWRRTPTHVH